MQEIGYDDDVDLDLAMRSRTSSAIDFEEEDIQEIVDAVVLW